MEAWPSGFNANCFALNGKFSEPSGAHVSVKNFPGFRRGGETVQMSLRLTGAHNFRRKTEGCRSG